MSRNNAVLLRILSGLNAGAEMELAPGEWVLGSGDESHLLIPAPGVMARHLSLQVAEDGSARLVPLEGEVALDGSPVGAGGTGLPDFAVFSTGGFTACIGPVGEAWPSPATPAARPAVPSSAADSAVSVPSEALFPPATAANAPADGDSAAHIVGGDKVGGKRILRLTARAVLACLLLVLALYGGFCPSDLKEAEELTRLLHEAGYGQTNAVKIEDGSLLVQGLVPGNTSLDELGLYVERLAPGTSIDVLSVEAVAQALQAAIRRTDAALRVSRAGAELRVTGYVYDLPTLEALFAEEQDLLRHVPVKMDVVVWKELAPRLTRLVQSHNLRSRLRILPGAYRISVQAQTLTQQQEESLNAVLREAEMEVYDTQPFVREIWEQPTRVQLPSAAKAAGVQTAPVGGAPSVTPPAPPEELSSGDETGESGNPAELSSLLFSSLASGGLRCEQVTVEGAGPSMAVVYEGNRYGVGAKLPNGYQVRTVTSRYVVFHIGRRYTQVCPARPLSP